MSFPRSTPSGGRDAAIYREAARIVLEGESLWGCIAISRAGNRCDAFCKLFDPSPEILDPLAKPRDDGWCWGIGERGNDKAAKERSIALCFMAAMVEAGDA